MKWLLVFDPSFYARARDKKCQTHVNYRGKNNPFTAFSIKFH